LPVLNYATVVIQVLISGGYIPILQFGGTVTTNVPVY
jgi:hypothetical protein